MHFIDSRGASYRRSLHGRDGYGLAPPSLLNTSRTSPNVFSPAGPAVSSDIGLAFPDKPDFSLCRPNSRASPEWDTLLARLGRVGDWLSIDMIVGVGLNVTLVRFRIEDVEPEVLDPEPEPEPKPPPLPLPLPAE